MSGLVPRSEAAVEAFQVTEEEQPRLFNQLFKNASIGLA
jgi:hypothetical protein